MSSSYEVLGPCPVPDDKLEVLSCQSPEDAVAGVSELVPGGSYFLYYCEQEVDNMGLRRRHVKVPFTVERIAPDGAVMMTVLGTPTSRVFPTELGFKPFRECMWWMHFLYVERA